MLFLLQVLATIPWHLVHIKVLDIEVSHIVPEGSEAVQVFMEARGYKFFKSQGEDYFFYDPKYKEEFDLRL